MTTNLQLSVDEGYTLLHGEQSDAGAFAPASTRTEAATGGNDLDCCGLQIPQETNLHTFRGGVSTRILNSLLRDTIENGHYRSRNRFITSRSCCYLYHGTTRVRGIGVIREMVGRIPGEPLEGRDETEIVQDARVHGVREQQDLFEGVDRKQPRSRDTSLQDFARCVVGRLYADTELHHESRERLSHGVVQFARNDGPLPISGGYHLGRQSSCASAVSHQAVQQNIEHARDTRDMAIGEHRSRNARVEITVPDVVNGFLECAKGPNGEHYERCVEQQSRQERHYYYRKDRRGAQFPMPDDQRRRGRGDEQEDIRTDQLDRQGSAQE